MMMETDAATLPRPAPQRVPRAPFWIAALLLGGAVAAGANLHWRQNELAATTQKDTQDFRPALQFAVAQRSASSASVTLPGTTQPFEQARIFARATGYVAERRVDIGSRVHAGDLLARIAAPDLDAQLKQAMATLGQRSAELTQAQANVNQAQSNKELASVTNVRIAALAQQGWETKQNADQSRLTEAAQKATVASVQAGVTVAQANYEAQKATVEQLQELANFEKVTAPFDGIVTSRNVDTGDLISGTASGGTALFVLQRDDVLRVHVDVPQSASADLKDGLAATVILPERPDAVYAGTVARNAGSIDAGTRTLPAEVDVKNDSHELHPGSFVNVVISVPNATPTIVIPAGAILFDGGGLRVAVIGADNRIQMHPISIYRDYGTSIELRGGLEGGERVAVNSPAGLRDGAEVRIAGPAVPTPALPGAAPKPAPKS